MDLMDIMGQMGSGNPPVGDYEPPWRRLINLSKNQGADADRCTSEGFPESGLRGSSLHFAVAYHALHLHIAEGVSTAA